MNHSIKRMLRLIDHHLTILEITQEKIKHRKCCGANVIDENGKFAVVKNGKKKVTLRLENFNNKYSDIF